MTLWLPVHELERYMVTGEPITAPWVDRRAYTASVDLSRPLLVAVNPRTTRAHLVDGYHRLSAGHAYGYESLPVELVERDSDLGVPAPHLLEAV